MKVDGTDEITSRSPILDKIEMDENEYNLKVDDVTIPESHPITRVKQQNG